ncbi:MAG TPA: peptidyl-prolyl cis-trans isomerase [Actinomycetota bacterium]|nr:peptidyl-prolyl cis-trans isomerase [Actinomycetota bacterium]
MRKSLVVLAVIALSATGCARLFDPAAAVVNGRKITVDDVGEGLDEFKKTTEYQSLTQQGDPEAIQRQFEQAYLSQLIRRAVLEPEADKLGVEVTDQDVTDRLDEIKASFDTPEAFQEALKEQGLDEDRLRVLVRDNLLEEAVKAEVTKSAEPTDEQLQSYYDKHKSDYTQVRSQHILVKNKELADGLFNQLEAAPKNTVDELFKTLAKEYSEDADTASKAGDVGFHSPGELDPAYENAEKGLGVGDIAHPVKTDGGFDIIRVTDRRAAPFTEVRDDIASRLSDQVKEEAFTNWLKDAYERADIRINSRYGELDVESQQVVDPTVQNIPGAERSASPLST